MLGTSIGSNQSNSLLNEYATLLGDAILRHRARVAEHSARVEAELANKLKSEFIANMSHELRTPLNTVIGFSRLLGEHDKRPLGTEKVAEYGSLINEAAQHLLSIINDILEISKIQSGRFNLDLSELQLDDILPPCIAFFRLQAAEATVELVLDIEANLPLVTADSVKLRQILMNLVGNAIKFTPAGGRVSVSARAISTQRVRIAITDTGVGMAPEEIAIALIPFGQVDGGRSRKHEGTGLGLPIAKALIELHGGSFEITSAKGEGTEVAAILPLAPASSSRDISPALRVRR